MVNPRKFFLTIHFQCAIYVSLFLFGCQQPEKQSVTVITEDTVTIKSDQQDTIAFAATTIQPDVHTFIPKGYELIAQLSGDLDNNGSTDHALLIKGTDKKAFVEHEYRGTLDQNRRGLIILIKGKEGYRKAVSNLQCFSSANEDGGVYYPPELSLEVDTGKVYISYAHGRYGFWKYTFRYQDNDLLLIGYDGSENFGPVVNREISINYLTGKKIVKRNTNEQADGGDEVFEQTISRIPPGKLVTFSSIKDFDELGIPGD